MNKTDLFAILCCIFCCFCTTQAQQTLQEVKSMQHIPNIYSAKRINTDIKIDGKMDSIWHTAEWSSYFQDIEGTNKPTPRYHTRFKMLWNDDVLYIYAILEEPHIWGTITQRDAIVYHDNDFEVFLKPKINSPVYYEIEINPLNTLFDLFMPKPYKHGGQAKIHWDLAGIHHAIHIDGTLNNPTDNDKSWSVEIAIPFKSILSFGTSTPKVNDYWRINFSRVQWQHELLDQQYSRRKKENKIIPEDNWVWSSIGLINMHYPERWGFLHFTDSNITPPLPEYYAIEKLAWNIHYLQQIHFKQHKKYSDKAKNLTGYQDIIAADLQKFNHSILIDKNGKYYRITLKTKDDKKYYTIDSQGHYTTNYD